MGGDQDLEPGPPPPPLHRGKRCEAVMRNIQQLQTREEEDLQRNFSQLIPGDVEVRESQFGEEAGVEEIGEEDGEREASPGEVVGGGDKDGGTCVHHLQRLIRLVQSVLEI